jgi:agmatine/peptidylarginine deiminase
MFFDSFTNTICLPKALLRYPSVHAKIALACEKCGIKIVPIINTKNIWARDYMPIQVNDYFIKFKYKGYGPGDPYENYPHLMVSKLSYDFLPLVLESDIILDGGNCQRIDDLVFITEIVFAHNTEGHSTRLLAKLERIFQAEVILIPVEPEDTLGHTDGILKPIDRKHVFINDYSVMQDDAWKKYEDELTARLFSAGVNPVPFPYAYNKQPEMTEKEFRKKFPAADDFNPGVGYYINYLQVGNLFLLPAFGFEEDAAALGALRNKFPSATIEQIDCSDLAMEGGLLNCVTMNYCL